MVYVNQYMAAEVQRRTERRQRLAARNERLRELFAQLGTIAAVSRATGLDRATIRYAINPDHAAKRRVQMRFHYYLNHVLPRELDAEAAE